MSSTADPAPGMTPRRPKRPFGPFRPKTAKDNAQVLELLRELDLGVFSVEEAARALGITPETGPVEDGFEMEISVHPESVTVRITPTLVGHKRNFYIALAIDILLKVDLHFNDYGRMLVVSRRGEGLKARTIARDGRENPVSFIDGRNMRRAIGMLVPDRMVALAARMADDPEDAARALSEVASCPLALARQLLKEQAERDNPNAPKDITRP